MLTSAPLTLSSFPLTLLHVSRQFQNRDASIGKHADVGGDLQRALGDLPGAPVGLRQQGPRGGQREVASRPDGDDAVVRLDQLSGTAQEKAVLQVSHHQQRLQPAEDPVAAPVLGQLHRCPRQVAGIAVQLLLELFVERERIGDGAGESGQHLAALHGAHLVGVRLYDRLADADLAVAAQRDSAVLAYAEDGGSMKS